MILDIYSMKNWKEDYEGCMGGYMNRCLKCKDVFLGHKERLICKECVHGI